MDWEVVNGVTGVVSAIAALASLVFILLPRLRADKKSAKTQVIRTRVSAYILASSSWVLCVMCFNWIFEPFGPFVAESDERKLLGISLSLPALIALRYGVSVMRGPK